MGCRWLSSLPLRAYGYCRPMRSETLEAAVNWNYELLSPAERRLFEDSSVFADGFSLAGLAAVERVAAETDVLDVLGRLVDRSLVVVEPPRASGVTR